MVIVTETKYLDVQIFKTMLNFDSLFDIMKNTY